MATHTIMAEDWRAGGEPRSITWNDETGEIGGEHVMVPRLRALQRHAEIEGGFKDDAAWFRLPDPRLDPACVKCMLGLMLGPLLDRDALPEPLRSADSRALCVPARLEPGTIA